MPMSYQIENINENTEIIFIKKNQVGIQELESITEMKNPLDRLNNRFEVAE